MVSDPWTYSAGAPKISPEMRCPRTIIVGGREFAGRRESQKALANGNSCLRSKRLWFLAYRESVPLSKQENRQRHFLSPRVADHETSPRVAEHCQMTKGVKVASEAFGDRKASLLLCFFQRSVHAGTAERSIAGAAMPEKHLAARRGGTAVAQIIDNGHPYVGKQRKQMGDSGFLLDEADRVSRPIEIFQTERAGVAATDSQPRDEQEKSVVSFA